jgi:2-polyprenyl-6-methoxyphenol hydroxylase-like FAD-dependent oxidoreductase
MVDSADVIVIGSGGLGAATAFHAAKSGAHRVALVERLEIGCQFAPQLAGVVSDRRRSLVDALVCACDVYTWKLLRRGMRHSRPDVEDTMRTIVEALLRSA